MFSSARSRSLGAVRRLAKTHHFHTSTTVCNVLSNKSAEEYQKGNYTERMEKTGRPVSPHVMIYAFPVVALSSITVRITGVCLTIGLAGIGASSLVGGDPTAMMSSLGDSSLAPAFKFAVAFPLTYHFIGGCRHAYWDANPDAVTNESVESSSFGVVGVSTALSLATLAL